MPPTLCTARLLLPPVQDDDLPALHAHWNDPGVGRYLWDANPIPTATVADLIAQPPHLPDRRLGPLDPPPRPHHPPHRRLRPRPFEPGPGVELLYSLAPTHWSKGLATEAATAVLTHVFDTLGLPEILATTDDANEASLRLLTRLGATPTTRLQAGLHTYPCFTIHPPDDPGMLP